MAKGCRGEDWSKAVRKIVRKVRKEPWRGWEGYSRRGGKAERQTATLPSLGRGRAGNGAHVLCRIDSCISNLKQPHISQELRKCPFGH